MADDRFTAMYEDDSFQDAPVVADRYGRRLPKQKKETTTKKKAEQQQQQQQQQQRRRKEQGGGVERATPSESARPKKPSYSGRRGWSRS